MPIVYNPVRGEMVFTDNPEALYAQGYRDPTQDELAADLQREEFGTVGQQAQAQAERVVRGATFGAVEGFGDDPEAIRSRAEVSQELSPVTSFAASVAPDLGVAALTGGLGGLATGAGRAAGRAALASGAGLVRAGLATARAGGAAALAAESVGTGLVGAGQEAYGSDREFADNPGQFAEDALIWGGLNFGLGAFAMGVAGRGAKAGEGIASDSVDDIAKAAEFKAEQGIPEVVDGAPSITPESTPGTPGQIYDVEGAAAAAAPATPESADIDALSRQFNQVSGLPERVRGLLERRQQMSGRMDLGAGVSTPRKVSTAAEEMGLSEPELRGFLSENRIEPGRGDTIVPSELHQNPALSPFLDKLAIERYTENSAFLVNKKLRTVGLDKPWSYPGASAPEKRYYEGLKGISNRAADVLRRAPEQPNPIWRGTGVTQAQLDEWVNSGVVSDKGFQSFSTNEFGARNFMPVESFEGQFAELGHQRVLLRSPRGGYHFGGPEQEVMFPPDAKFRITGVSREANDTILDVEPMAARKPSRAGERGMAQLSGPDREAVEAVAGGQGVEALVNRIGPNFTIRDVLSSPMGNVTMAAGGAAAGAAIGEQEGAIAGGGVGLIASLLLGRRGGAALRRAGSKLEAAAVRQGERAAVEGGVERALRRSAESDAEDLVEQTIGKAPVHEGDSFSRQRRLYINRKAIQDVAAREMGEDLSKLVKDVGEVTRRDKVATVAREVSENLPAQRAVANAVAKDAAEFAGQLRAEARAYGAASGKKSLQYAIPGQKGLTLALMDHAKEIEKATSGKALFEALDNFKRTAQDYKLSLETGALNSANPIHHQQLIPRIDAFASKVRTALEDSGTWGKAGDMQRAYNAVISDRLMPSWRIFEETTMQRTHKGYDGAWNLEGWETKLSTLIKGTDPGARRHVGNVLDAMDELAGVRRQFGDAKMATRIETQVAKVRRTLGLADEVADATERMGALGELVGGVPMGGAIAGGIAGGLPGAAIGAALPGAVRGLVMGDLVAAYQRLSGATEAAAARGVDDWIKSSKVRGTGLRAGIKARLPSMSAEAKQLAEVAARRGVSQGMALFMGEDKTPGAAFERLRDKLLDDDAFFQSLEDEYGTLRKESPEAFMALAGRATLARQFLIERMPANVAVSMANPNGYPPNREAIEDWATYVNAVRHPTRVAKNIGSAQIQEIETLRTVHPRMHETLQAKTIEGIQRSQQSGDPLDDNFLMRVQILFPDADGVGSPVFSREYGKTVREYNAMQRQKGGGGAGSPKPKAMPSPLAATVQGGATFGSGF